MGERACYLAVCPACDLRVSIAEEICPDCGAVIDDAPPSNGQD